MDDIGKMDASLVHYVTTLYLSSRILEGALESIEGAGLDEDALKNVECKMWRFGFLANGRRTKLWWEGLEDLVNTLNKYIPDGCGKLNSIVEETLKILDIYTPKETEENKNA